MTPQRDIERVLERWLDDGINEMPDLVYLSILDRVERQPQQRAWRVSWRNPHVSTYIKPLAAVAAVVVIAVASIAILGRPPGSAVGGAASPAVSPAPSASPAPATPAPASTVPGATGPASFNAIEPGTVLEPGTYILEYAAIGGAARYPTLAFTFTLPAGWKRVELEGIAWRKNPEGDGGARLLMAVVDNLFVDPCDPDKGLRDPAVGPSVGDLSAALATVPGWAVEATSTGIFNGYAGERVDMVSPADDAACTADGSEGSRLLHVLGSPGYTLASGRERHDLRILDVGGTRVVVGIMRDADTTGEAAAELEAIADSVTIRP